MDRLANIRHVRQESSGGCVIASLAMIGGMTFQEVASQFPWVTGGRGCDMETVGSDFLYRHGFSWQRIYLYEPNAADEGHRSKLRNPWPPEPWAPAHLCMVETSQYHCVVMLADGTVLDPLGPEKKRLTDYTRCTQVWGIFDIIPKQSAA